MSALVRLLWAVSGEETRQDMVTMGREGERLAMALGAPALTRSAQALNVASDNEVVGLWADEYAAAAARVGGMPLEVLWAGVSGWDPRADALVMRLAAWNPPTWPAILDRLRTAPQGVRMAADWWSSLAIGLVRGNEQQQAQERIQRAWWGAKAESYPVPPPVGQTGGGRIPSSGTATTVQAQGGGGGLLLAALAAVVFILGGRRR